MQKVFVKMATRYFCLRSARNLITDFTLLNWHMSVLLASSKRVGYLPVLITDFTLLNWHMSVLLASSKRVGYLPVLLRISHCWIDTCPFFLHQVKGLATCQFWRNSKNNVAYVYIWYIPKQTTGRKWKELSPEEKRVVINIF